MIPTFKINYTKDEAFHEGFLPQMLPNPQETVVLVAFTDEKLNGVSFLCSDCSKNWRSMCCSPRKYVL